MEVFARSHFQSYRGCSQHVGGEHSLCAARKLQVAVEAHLHFYVAGVVVFIGNFTHQTYLETIDGYGGRLRQTGNIGVGGEIIVGGLEHVYPLQVVYSEYQNEECQKHEPSDDKFYFILFVPSVVIINASLKSFLTARRSGAASVGEL